MKRLLTLAAALCIAAAPPSPTLTDSEQGKFDKGQVVVRHAPSDSGGGVTAIAKVQAPPSVVLDEVMNLKARPSESSTLSSVEIYRKDAAPDRTGATFTVTVMGSNTVFSILYDCHRSKGYCTYTLDPTRENDLVSVVGHYLVVPEGTGTRLVYSSQAETGKSMPNWVRRWIAGSSLSSQVQGIRKRAEARP
ncbi:MAG: hypothetical protein AB8H79_26635 [Myxococcota bacterium]